MCYSSGRKLLFFFLRFTTSRSRANHHGRSGRPSHPAACRTEYRRVRNLRRSRPRSRNSDPFVGAHSRSAYRTRCCETDSPACAASSSAACSVVRSHSFPAHSSSMYSMHSGSVLTLRSRRFLSVDGQEEGDTGSRVRVASVEGNDIYIEDSRRKGESMPVDTGDKERQRTAIGC